MSMTAVHLDSGFVVHCLAFASCLALTIVTELSHYEVALTHFQLLLYGPHETPFADPVLCIPDD